MALDLEIGEFIYENNIGKDMVLDAQFDGESITPGSIITKISKIDLILGNGKKQKSRKLMKIMKSYLSIFHSRLIKARNLSE